jgi:hypothetical protein
MIFRERFFDMDYEKRSAIFTPAAIRILMMKGSQTLKTKNVM